jgi:hypothetical protein
MVWFFRQTFYKKNLHSLTNHHVVQLLVNDAVGAAGGWRLRGRWRGAHPDGAQARRAAWPILPARLLVSLDPCRACRTTVILDQIRSPQPLWSTSHPLRVQRHPSLPLCREALFRWKHLSTYFQQRSEHGGEGDKLHLRPATLSFTSFMQRGFVQVEAT